MFVAKPKKITLTLLFSVVLALVLATGSEAQAHAAEVPVRREHENLKRFVKKRSPQLFGGVIGAGAAPGSGTTTATSAAASTSSKGGGLGGILTDIFGNGDKTTSTATTPPPTTTTPPPTTSTTLPPTTTTPPPTTSTTSTPDVVIDTATPTVVVTASVDAPSATATGIPAQNAAMQKTGTTILIVVASVVGGVALIWTIIRKWIFRPSDDFEDRIQPIDFLQPVNDTPSGLPSRRLSVASSFHSGGHGNGSEEGLAPHHGMGSGGSFSGNELFVPGAAPYSDHDFTAGPQQLAPVGGYADLARGPSPGPQMSEAGRGGPAYQQDPYDYNGRY